MKIKTLLAATIVGLVPAMAAAQNCDRLWANSTPEQIAAVQLWAESQGAYKPRRERYDAHVLGEAILQHVVKSSCSEAFSALRLQNGDPVSDEQYVRHLLRLNFATESNRPPRYIPQMAFMQLLEGSGVNLGLPQPAVQPSAQSSPAQTTGASQQTSGNPYAGVPRM